MWKFTVVFIALTIPMVLHAEVPKLINYSGKIINNQTGQLASDGDYDMVFTLYDGPSGASVWQEGHNSPGNRVHITNGMYNVILGGITPMPSFDKNYYLEMQFKKYTDSTYEVFPKQQLLSNAYAIRSEYANQVADNSISTAKIQNGAVNSLKIAGGTIVGGNIANATITNSKIADNAIDIQSKAPWAPRIRFNQSSNDALQPKIAAGDTTTDTHGKATIYFPSDFFTQTPLMSVAVITWEGQKTHQSVDITTINSILFTAESWSQGPDAQLGLAGPIHFNWMAIGY